jgi:hypothetical protein
MGAKNTSYDLLAHFDGPVGHDAAEFVGPSTRHESNDALVKTRGIAWVLKWFAAMAVIAFAASILVEFAYIAAAKSVMIRAARAGALEATLPRATYQSVSQTVARRLAGHRSLASHMRLGVFQNGVPVGATFQPQQGDDIAITIMADASAVLPGWLQRMRFWQRRGTIDARAERQIPGRQVKAANHPEKSQL